MPASTDHIVLVGMMGSGKTTVGRALAARLGREFVDSDEVIQSRTGRTVRQIFAAEGEAAFRALETTALLDALEGPEPLVIAAAGGVVLSETNRKALCADGVRVVWLTAPLGVLTERAESGGHRPLLDEDPDEAMARLYAAREPLYREVADARIDTHTRTVDDIVDEIVAMAS